MCTSAPIAVAKAVVSSPMVPGPQTRIRFPGPAGPHPAGIPPAAERRPHAAPLVTGADREADLALGEVGQLPGVQLDVGPADPGPANVAHDLTRPRHRHLDILDPCRPGPSD